MASVWANLIRGPFQFLFARTSQEERVAAYVLREHARGRSLADILADRYVGNRLTPQQASRLLDRPELVHALGEDVVEATRTELSSGT